MTYVIVQTRFGLRRTTIPNKRSCTATKIIAIVYSFRWRGRQSTDVRITILSWAWFICHQIYAAPLFRIPESVECLVGEQNTFCFTSRIFLFFFFLFTETKWEIVTNGLGRRTTGVSSCAFQGRIVNLCCKIIPHAFFLHAKVIVRIGRFRVAHVLIKTHTSALSDRDGVLDITRVVFGIYWHLRHGEVELHAIFGQRFFVEVAQSQGGRSSASRTTENLVVR